MGVLFSSENWGFDSRVCAVGGCAIAVDPAMEVETDFGFVLGDLDLPL